MTIRYLLLTALLLGLPGMADAQRQPPMRERAPADVFALSAAEVVNLLDAYAIVQAQQSLQLDDDRYGEFVTRLKRLQQTRRSNQQRRHGILQELRRMSAASPIDERALGARLQALAAHDQRAASELTRAYAALDEVLDLRQRARFRLLEEQLELRKIDLLQRARRGAARDRRQ